MDTKIEEFIVATCESKDGHVGSLFFPKGRIRLEHHKGPKIEFYEQLHRFLAPPFKELELCVDCANADKKDEWLGILKEECRCNIGSDAQDTGIVDKFFQEWRNDRENAWLIEIADGKLRTRGYLFRIDGLTQEYIDGLRGNIEKNKSNESLRTYIMSNEALAKKLGYK